MKQRRLKIAVLVLALVLPFVPTSAQTLLPISGNNISFGISNDVGSSTTSVYSVAVGHLDDNGYLDIVSGSLSSEDYEVIAWQNDGTPFSGLWTQNDVGASSADVYAVAVGDLDNDNDLDIVSGSWSGEGYEITVWENDGTPFDGLWVPNNVGASTSNVRSVAVGHLDDNDYLDIVSGSDSGEDYEVIAWQNDGTPFSGLWTQNDVGASSTTVSSVGVGDLDNDNDLDIVSGSYSGEDYEVIAWQNDGTPFSGLWTQNDVGASTSNVRSVAVGHLDDNDYLDIVSGSESGEDYEVIAWQNDGTPFSGLWTQNDVGASTSNVRSVAVGDLDNDSDLDIVSGSESGEDYEVIVWQNGGGLWMQKDVGASTASVYSVAVGDLDNNGCLDIVSGGNYNEDYEVIVWPNICDLVNSVYLPIIMKLVSS